MYLIIIAFFFSIKGGTTFEVKRDESALMSSIGYKRNREEGKSIVR